MPAKTSNSTAVSTTAQMARDPMADHIVDRSFGTVDFVVFKSLRARLHTACTWPMK